MFNTGPGYDNDNVVNMGLEKVTVRISGAKSKTRNFEVSFAVLDVLAFVSRWE